MEGPKRNHLEGLPGIEGNSCSVDSMLMQAGDAVIKTLTGGPGVSTHRESKKSNICFYSQKIICLQGPVEVGASYYHLGTEVWHVCWSHSLLQRHTRDQGVTINPQNEKETNKHISVKWHILEQDEAMLRDQTGLFSTS